MLALFRRVTKPLVRLFLEKGVTYTLLLEELKRVFVEVASEEFKINNKPQTDSRITMLTGVHRRDVHRFRTEKEKPATFKSNFSAQLIAQWIGNPRFLDHDGKPKLLARFNKTGAEDTFDLLVSSVSKDIRARPVFDEWLRTGVISVNDDGFIKLNIEAFIPKDNIEEKLFFLGMNVHDHLAAAVNNTLNEGKMFERCVYYDQLTMSQVEEVHELTKQYGMEYLKIINKKTIEITQSNVLAADTSYRMNTGVYFYFEKSTEPIVDEK